MHLGLGHLVELSSIVHVLLSDRLGLQEGEVLVQVELGFLLVGQGLGVSGIGLQPLTVGLLQAGLGLQHLASGLGESGFGLPFGALSLLELALALRYRSLGLSHQRLKRSRVELEKGLALTHHGTFFVQLLR